MRILLIEDNENLGRYVVRALEEDGYAVDWSKDGDAGLRHVESNPPDLLLLDRMLPGTDGVAVSKHIRSAGIDLPIIMLTALGETDDRVEGLDAGADDYLVKPFEMKELLARVRALLRRPPKRTPEILRVQDVELHLTNRTVEHNGKPLTLTAKEFSVLEYLFRNTGRVVTRAELLEHCWEFSYNPFSNITDVYIRKLRKKLHDKNEKYIKTIRGTGYRLEE